MKRKGFTLIELLVVIAIIALLLSVITPSLRKAKDAAKMIMCANNQKQTLIGLFAYQADNDALYPPHPADRGNDTFSVLNYFNYYQHLTGEGVPANSRGAHYYLSSYLPLVDVFACPLGRSKDLSELQWQYDNYKDHFAGTRPGTDPSHGSLTSYNLYWGGYQFTSSPIAGGLDFIGPDKGAKGEANLLISDSVFNWGVAVGRPEWWLAHKPSKGSGQFLGYDYDPTPWKNYCGVFWLYIPSQTVTGPLPNEMREMKMNAGYTDGSVVRFSGADTSIVWSEDYLYYIPRKWR